MLEECVRHSKPFPDYSRSDAHQVWLSLHGEVQDVNFRRFLERIGQDELATYDRHDFLLLGLVAREQKIPEALRSRALRLLELGVLERIARGELVLSHKHYRSVRRPASADRGQRYLLREQRKTELLQHIEQHRAAGSRMQELMALLPTLSRDQVRALLRELRRDGKAHPVGATKTALWHPGPEDVL